MGLEQQFHEAMLEIYRRAKKGCHYSATYFLQMVTEHGGLTAAKTLLHTDTPSDGFTALWEHGRMDLSVEYHVLLPEFAPLFTPEERRVARKRLEQYEFTDFPPSADDSTTSQPDHTSRDANPPQPIAEAALVARLIEFGENVGEKELVFSNDPLIGDLIKKDPFGFLLAASLDRGMAAEMAWRLPAKIYGVLGHLDPERIAGMSEEEILAVLKQLDGKPRYLNDAPKTIRDVANRVVREYEGDASKLWRNQRSWTIKRRMQAIHGVGPGIASMVVNLLAHLGELQLQPEDYTQMDVKPDVHVRRVFERLGFCEKEATEQEAVEAARRLHPAYPGKLDAPAWHIGRTWCHAHRPTCEKCPIGDVCPSAA